MLFEITETPGQAITGVYKGSSQRYYVTVEDGYPNPYVFCPHLG